MVALVRQFNLTFVLLPLLVALAPSLEYREGDSRILEQTESVEWTQRYSTLVFASRAKRVRAHPVVNRVQGFQTAVQVSPMIYVLCASLKNTPPAPPKTACVQPKGRPVCRENDPAPPLEGAAQTIG